MSPVKDRSPDIAKYPLSIGPPVEVRHSQQSPPSYPAFNNNTDGNNVEPNLSSSSLQVTSSGRPTFIVHNNYYYHGHLISTANHYHTDSYPSSYHSSSPPIRLSPQVSHISHDPPPYPAAANVQHHTGSGDPHSYPSQESSHKE